MNTGGPPAPGIVKPARLREGDTVGLVMPSFAQWDPVPVDILLDTLKALNLKGKLGTHLFDRRGYFAGRDEDRAADVNAMFADPEVKAMHCVRGGWGAARLLPLLDWNTIARNPKILVGYSDITALLLSLHARTGLVTFHGPGRGVDVEHLQPGLDEAGALERRGGDLRQSRRSPTTRWCP